ncbi:GIY-YIG nuclease family protein [Oceanicoccus sagamiensis]|uniref:Endonuclease n=1 Tax=Oceanicoccus sagamiensis TaxID=716816 RepID=A0A1X9ND03_9GAMM|nr:GIY-YIG nuclease family protein [Oceanicoccus sagamiensis]ARN72837.1 endonuclease [Oceanicoccus sagamiensis]
MTAKTETSWWVYMVETQSGKLYTGITTDVERRFAEHSGRAGNKGAKFFRSDKPKKVVFQEQSANRSEASKRESEIKKLSRREKCQLAGVVYRPIRK